tara:strand:- start:210 stop:554 length:345 start_codon:yes stop_codon:yes gene_type:complete
MSNSDNELKVQYSNELLPPPTNEELAKAKAKALYATENRLTRIQRTLAELSAKERQEFLAKKTESRGNRRVLTKNPSIKGGKKTRRKSTKSRKPRKSTKSRKPRKSTNTRKRRR